MRICHSLLCDAAADVMARGKPWCRPCYLKRFGIRAGQDGNPSPSGAVTGAPSSEGAPSSGKAGADGYPPALPSFDELAAILEGDGWHEVEFELLTRHGMTLHDLARRLEAELAVTA